MRRVAEAQPQVDRDRPRVTTAEQPDRKLGSARAPEHAAEAAQCDNDAIALQSCGNHTVFTHTSPAPALRRHRTRQRLYRRWLLRDNPPRQDAPERHVSAPRVSATCQRCSRECHVSANDGQYIRVCVPLCIRVCSRAIRKARTECLRPQHHRPRRAPSSVRQPPGLASLFGSAR